MIVQIGEDQKVPLEKGVMTKVLVPKKEYKVGDKVHVSTGLFGRGEKVAVKECKSVLTVLVEPKHSCNSAIIEVDYLMLSTKEKEQFAIACGYKDLETFLKTHDKKKTYSLINFK